MPTELTDAEVGLEGLSDADVGLEAPPPEMPPPLGPMAFPKLGDEPTLPEVLSQPTPAFTTEPSFPTITPKFPSVTPAAQAAFPATIPNVDLSAFQSTEGLQRQLEAGRDVPEPLLKLPTAPDITQEPRSLLEHFETGPTQVLFGEKAADVQAQVTRTMYNVAKSVPEFLSTPEGMLSVLASLIPAGRLGVEAYFTYDMAKTLFDQAKELGGKWDELSTLDKASAITQAAATLGFTTLLGKAGLNEVTKPLKGKAQALWNQMKPEGAEPSAAVLPPIPYPEEGIPGINAGRWSLMTREQQIRNLVRSGISEPAPSPAPTTPSLTPVPKPIPAHRQEDLISKTVSEIEAARVKNKAEVDAAEAAIKARQEGDVSQTIGVTEPTAPAAVAAVAPVAPAVAPVTSEVPVESQSIKMQKARRVKDMSAEELAKAFPGGMNPENWDLGETATAAEVIELKRHREDLVSEMESLQKTFSDKSKAGEKLTLAEMNKFQDIASKMQYFNEAIQAAPKSVGGDGRVFANAAERAKARPAVEPIPKPAAPPPAPAAEPVGAEVGTSVGKGGVRNNPAIKATPVRNTPDIKAAPPTDRWDRLYAAEHADLMDAQRRMEEARQYQDVATEKQAKQERDDILQRLGEFDKLSRRSMSYAEPPRDLESLTIMALRDNPRLTLAEATADAQERIALQPENDAYDSALDAGEGRAAAKAAAKKVRDAVADKTPPSAPPAESPAPAETAGNKVEIHVEELSNGFRVSGLDVPASQQGKGLGTAKMREVIARSDASGKPIVLTAHATSKALQPKLNAFYERLGFKHFRDDPLSGKPMYRYDPPPSETPAVKPAEEIGPLFDVPKSKKPLQAERNQIVRLLSQLEEESPRSKRIYPKEGKEETVNRLRARLAEIEQQLMPKMPETPVTTTPIATTPEAPIPPVLKREDANPPVVQQKAPFSPKAAKAQKKFLMTEVDKAIREAPEIDAKTLNDDYMASPENKERQVALDWINNNPYPKEPQKSYTSTEGKTPEQASARFDADHAQWEKDVTEWMAKGHQELAELAQKYNVNPRLSAPSEIMFRARNAYYARQPHVTIDIPGDGTYSIVNHKDALKAFKEEHAGRFPTTSPKGQKVSNMRETATAAAPIGEMDAENVAKTAATTASDEPTRKIINYLWSDGSQTVATDGCRLIIIESGLGGTAKKPQLFHPDGKPLTVAEMKEAGNFPNYKQVIPDYSSADAFFKGMDTGRLFTILRQAQEATSDRSKTVTLWKNTDGSFGMSSGSSEISYQHNIQEGARILVALDPKYFIDAVNAVRRMGSDKVDILGKDELSPIIVKGKGVQTVIMPMRLDGDVRATPTAMVNPESAPSKPAAGEGQVLGFGGGARPPRTPAPPGAAPQPAPLSPAPPTPVTQQQVVALQNHNTPGLSGIQSLLLPSAKGPASLRAAELLGSKLGPMHQRSEASAAQLRPFSRFFDKLGVQREGVAPSDNPGIKFMSDMSQGRTQTKPTLVKAAALVEKLFAARIALLEKAGAALQTVRENYFPGMWTKESRLAFNAAVEQLGPNFDLANATPAQKVAVKALVDQFITDGTVSEKDALGYLTRKPLAGKESFRKQKVFDDIMDAAEFGLRPVSNNPIDLVQLKLAEMDKSIMAHQYFQDLKAKGQLKIINPYDQVPDGWVKVNDKYGTIYGPPTVTIPEYIDKQVYQGLLKIAKDLGISHERLMRFPPGPGSQALGLSFQGQNRILSRFGTETSVIAHEIGHQLDLKYGLWDYLTGGERGTERNSPIQKELRAIADETERGDKARKKEEKMAQVMEAYIHAPERMKEIAPTLFAKFDAFVKGVPELKAFSEIKPGLALENLASEKYVGLPILGYRIVPEAHGEIVNNYLSSSLYNNRYFGGLYKGWMGMANTLNQTQLGMGSMFHAGFTTGEAQISSGANILKDVYGVLRGNRTVKDLGASVLKNVASVIRNPVVGDRVLNAWREGDGQINPKIAQVVRAAELGGGGFKLESGLQTEQTVKMVRDWYSGNRLKAAARSPFALTELLAKPTMEFLVPRQKAGVFADLAWRIIEQNPGKSLEDLTPQFRQAWNRVDARLGQVRYDRLFTNNSAKNVVQGLVRAPGWSGGTIAEIGGGFADAGRFMSEWVKTGKLPENLPDRTAYVLSLLATVTATNAALTYAFTGTQPKGLDFFAFRTGNKDEQGREERFLIPSYMKDMLAYASHPGETLLNKAHPLISMLSDLAKNKDYYGVEIRGRDSSIPAQVGQTVAYVVKSFEPFWTRGTRRERERGADILSPRTIAPLVGVMPAPRSVTQTKAEALAHEMMLAQIPAGARTREQAERSRINAEKHKGEDYLVRTVKRLSADSAIRVWQKANSEERAKLKYEVQSKIRRSKTLSSEDKDRLLKLLREQ